MGYPPPFKEKFRQKRSYGFERVPPSPPLRNFPRKFFFKIVENVFFAKFFWQNLLFWSFWWTRRQFRQLRISSHDNFCYVCREGFVRISLVIRPVWIEEGKRYVPKTHTQEQTKKYSSESSEILSSHSHVQSAVWSKTVVGCKHIQSTVIATQKRERTFWMNALCIKIWKAVILW